MKLLYGINILKHPKIKTEDDIKRIIQHLNTGPNWIINSGESYIIRKTLSESWVWDKCTRTPTDIIGRLYDNKIVENWNQIKKNDIIYEVGRNPNKGFLMIDNTLWGIAKFDNSSKGRNLQRLNIDDNILQNIATEQQFDQRKQYNYNFYYVDSLSIEQNLQNIIQQCEFTIINFNENIPFIIFKTNKEEISHEINNSLGIFSF